MSNLYKKFNIFLRQDGERGEPNYIVVAENNVKNNLEILEEFTEKIKDIDKKKFYKGRIETAKVLLESGRYLDEDSRLNNLEYSSANIKKHIKNVKEYLKNEKESQKNKNYNSKSEGSNKSKDRSGKYRDEELKKINVIKDNVRERINQLEELIKEMNSKEKNFYKNYINIIQNSLNDSEKYDIKYSEDLLKSVKNSILLVKEDLKREKSMNEKKYKSDDKSSKPERKEENPKPEREKTNVRYEEKRQTTSRMSEEDKKVANIKLRDVNDLRKQVNTLKNDLKQNEDQMKKISESKARKIGLVGRIERYKANIIEAENGLNNTRTDAVLFLADKENEYGAFDKLMKQGKKSLNSVSSDVLVDGLKKSVEVKNNHLTELLSGCLIDLSRDIDKTSKLIESFKDSVVKNDQSSIKKFGKDLENDITPRSSSYSYESSTEDFKSRGR